MSTKWEHGFHLKFLPQFFIALLSIWRNWNIEIFPFLLAQTLKPTIQTDQNDGLKPRALRSDVQVYPIISAYHPSTPCFCSSEMPKDMAPMKSFLLVRSQSHTSTDKRLSLSVSLRLLWWREVGKRHCTHVKHPHPHNCIADWFIFHSQAEVFIPGRIEGALDGFGLLLALALWVWN